LALVLLLLLLLLRDQVLVHRARPALAPPHDLMTRPSRWLQALARPFPLLTLVSPSFSRPP
jgi:hypothetical protein